MIDYLERIFAPGQDAWTGEADKPLPAVRLSGEEPISMSRVALQPEPPRWVQSEKMPGEEPVFRVPVRGAWEQPVGMNGVEMGWEEPEQGAQERAARFKMEQQQVQQGLEHRLRRESRRYDGPFYRY